MWSVKALFGISFLVTSRVAPVVAQAGSCQLNAAASKECVSSRAVSSMSQAIKYLG